MVKIRKFKPCPILKKTARAIGRSQVSSSELWNQTEDLFTSSYNANEDFLQQCKKQKEILLQDIKDYKGKGDFDKVRTLRKELKEIDDQMIMYASCKINSKKEQESKKFIDKVMEQNKAYIKKSIKK